MSKYVNLQSRSKNSFQSRCNGHKKKCLSSLLLFLLVDYEVESPFGSSLSVLFLSFLQVVQLNSIESFGSSQEKRREKKTNRIESTSIDQSHYTDTIKSSSHSYASSSYNSSILRIPILIILISVFSRLCYMCVSDRVG